MKNFSVLILLILVLSACRNDDNGLNSLPSCVQDIVEDESSADILLTVKKRTTNDVDYYWLNTGFSAFDGSEFIVTEQCDTTCYICGFCLPPMPLICDPTLDWEVVWEK